MSTGLSYQLIIDEKEDYKVIAFVVDEAVASLYQVHLIISRYNSDQDTSPDIINRKASFNLLLSREANQQIKHKSFHGIVSDWEALNDIPSNQQRLYKITIKPRLSKTALIFGNETYIDKTAIELIEQILQDVGLKSDKDYDLSSLESKTIKYPKQACKVKYGETHLDFLHRILEQEGIYYIFVQTDNGEKLCFYDDKKQASLLEKAKLYFDPEVTLDTDYQMHFVREIKRSYSITPLKIYVQGEHQDFGSHRPISAEYKIDPITELPKLTVLERGIYHYGLSLYDAQKEADLAKARYEYKSNQNRLKSLQSEQYKLHKIDQLLIDQLSETLNKNQEALSQAENALYESLTTQAKRFAQVKLEAEACNADKFEGNGWALELVSGYPVSLEQHPLATYNADLYLTEIQHKGVDLEQKKLLESLNWNSFPFPLTFNQLEQLPAYYNSFKAIPATVQYRMPLKTPIPEIDGLLVGFVDTEVQEEKNKNVSLSEHLDEQGRYHVRFLFDRPDKEQQLASSWLPMMQPFSGNQEGMHFPLLPGTRVSISCVNANPDRCVIVHALPDLKSLSPVTHANSYEKKILTASQNSLVFDDTPGKEKIELASPQGSTKFTMGYFEVDSPRAGGVQNNSSGHVMNQLGAYSGVMMSTEGKQLRVSTGGSELVQFSPGSMVDGRKTYRVDNIDELVSDLKMGSVFAKGIENEGTEQIDDVSMQPVREQYPYSYANYDHVNVDVGAAAKKVSGAIKIINIPHDGESHYVEINHGEHLIDYKSAIKSTEQQEVADEQL